jgi:hypothetical protein
MKAQENPQRREAVGAVDFELSTSLVRRRLASLRCPPLKDGRRDPLDPCADSFRLAPAGFGLDGGELAAEVLRLERAGWRPWEVRACLGLAWCGDGRP